jgi:hypothetical protein
MLFYSVAGLVLGSEVPLAGLIHLPQAAEAAAIVRLGDVPDRISHPMVAGPNWAAGETGLLLSIPGLASFLLSEGKEIGVQLARGRGPEDAAAFLMQNLLGLLMQQRGRIVLRASSIAVDGTALLFCGDSAAGKSAVAAAMAARGHSILGDDFCTIDWGADGAALIHGDGACPMLWTDSIEALGLGSAAATAVRAGCHKYHVRPPARGSDGLPLGAIYFLGEDRRVETCRIGRPRGMKAVQAIRDSVYRARALATAAQRLCAFEAATRIARQARMFSLARTSGFDWIDDGLGAVETGWNDAPETRESP